MNYNYKSELHIYNRKSFCYCLKYNKSKINILVNFIRKISFFCIVVNTVKLIIPTQKGFPTTGNGTRLISQHLTICRKGQHWLLIHCKVVQLSACMLSALNLSFFLIYIYRRPCIYFPFVLVEFLTM